MASQPRSGTATALRTAAFTEIPRPVPGEMDDALTRVPEANHGRQPFVFVVGCPRSGTTLLQRMLDAHPMLAVASDTYFIPRAVERFGLHADLRLTAELERFVRRYPRADRLGLPEAAFREAADESVTYPEFVSRIYQRFATAAGKPLAGEKAADYLNRIPLLHRLFPHAKFLHVIRDGREVALSTLSWANANRGPGRHPLWERSPLSVCALWWAEQVTLGRRAGQLLGPDRYHEVRYEELVTDPERMLREVAAFLGLPDDAAIPNFHVGPTRPEPGPSGNSVWLPVSRERCDPSRDFWKGDLALFEALAGDVLLELGYPRLSTERVVGVAVAAQYARRLWNLERSRRAEKAERDNGSIRDAGRLPVDDLLRGHDGHPTGATST